MSPYGFLTLLYFNFLILFSLPPSFIILLQSPYLLLPPCLHISLLPSFPSISLSFLPSSPSSPDNSTMATPIDVTGMSEQIQAEMQVKQFRDFLVQYNKLSESCFSACVWDFTSRSIRNNEENCVQNCVEKYTKVRLQLFIVLLLLGVLKLLLTLQ